MSIFHARQSSSRRNTSEGTALSREYEDELHRHYNFKGYWVDEPVTKKDSNQRGEVKHDGSN